MAGSDKESECYESASRLEHNVVLPLIDSGAALAAAVVSVAVRMSHAAKRSAGSTRRQGADGAHRSGTRST
jgi:hypothetical protein